MRPGLHTCLPVVRLLKILGGDATSCTARSDRFTGPPAESCRRSLPMRLRSTASCRLASPVSSLERTIMAHAQVTRPPDVVWSRCPPLADPSLPLVVAPRRYSVQPDDSSHRPLASEHSATQTPTCHYILGGPLRSFLFRSGTLFPTLALTQRPKRHRRLRAVGIPAPERTRRQASSPSPDGTVRAKAATSTDGSKSRTTTFARVARPLLLTTRRSLCGMRPRRIRRPRTSGRRRLVLDTPGLCGRT